MNNIKTVINMQNKLYSGLKKPYLMRKCWLENKGLNTMNVMMKKQWLMCGYKILKPIATLVNRFNCMPVDLLNWKQCMDIIVLKMLRILNLYRILVTLLRKNTGDFENIIPLYNHLYISLKVKIVLRKCFISSTKKQNRWKKKLLKAKRE